MVHGVMGWFSVALSSPYISITPPPIPHLSTKSRTDSPLSSLNVLSIRSQILIVDDDESNCSTHSNINETNNNPPCKNSQKKKKKSSFLFFSSFSTYTSEPRKWPLHWIYISFLIVPLSSYWKYSFGYLKRKLTKKKKMKEMENEDGVK